MKKLFAVAAVMFSLAVIARAEFYEIPKGGGNALATADYGGYKVDVATLGWDGSRNPEDGLVVVRGVQFSSGASAAGVIIYDATDTVNAVANVEVARVYNIYGSTAMYISGIGAGPAPLVGPIRLLKGLCWKPVNGNTLFNAISILYNRIGGE